MGGVTVAAARGGEGRGGKGGSAPTVGSWYREWREDSFAGVTA